MPSAVLLPLLPPPLQVEGQEALDAALECGDAAEVARLLRRTEGDAQPLFERAIQLACGGGNGGGGNGGSGTGGGAGSGGGSNATGRAADYAAAGAAGVPTDGTAAAAGGEAAVATQGGPAAAPAATTAGENGTGPGLLQTNGAADSGGFDAAALQEQQPPAVQLTTGMHASRVPASQCHNQQQEQHPPRLPLQEQQLQPQQWCPTR